jgi:hypothetical protein
MVSNIPAAYSQNGKRKNEKAGSNLMKKARIEPLNRCYRSPFQAIWR